MAKLVIDANRIISALLKDGSTRSAILDTRATLFAPEVLHDEIAKHAPEIARRVGVTGTELVAILRPLLKRIEWVSEANYGPFLKGAKGAMEKVDPEDIAYLACALAVGADAIWSHDLDFDRRNLVPRVAHPSARIR